MPGLLRGVARTAVVAGTATAVSGRVQRRQAKKYASKDAEIYAERQAAYQAQTSQPQYAVPAASYQNAAPPAPYAPPLPPAPAQDDMVAKIKQLSQLHAQGVLTDDEFAAAKAKLISG